MIKIRHLGLLLALMAVFQVRADDTIWQKLPELRAFGMAQQTQQFRVDTLTLRQLLQEAALRRPHEPVYTISLPLPDGSFGRFEIYESSIMADELAQRYPDIKTFKVYGIDDPGASGRLSLTPQGFRAMLHTAQGRVMIDPDSIMPSNNRYTLRTQGGVKMGGYSCGVDEHDFAPASSPLAEQGMSARSAARISGSFLRYRLAVAATREYVALFGGSKAAAHNAVVDAIVRVNEIYERDLGIQFVLVGNNDDLYEIRGNVNFTDGDPARMFIENQAWIDSKVGNYDVGHVFGTAGGGLAYLGSACDDDHKAQGVSAIGAPLADPFYIDFVAHEIGHQFNAEHSFNGSTRFCKEGRVAKHAFEPGSGSSIMAYAGICGSENLQDNSDATFHASSIAVIHRFTQKGGRCYDQVAANPANSNEPILAALVNLSIPANTPFVLDASASDLDGDSLTYQWDQMDKGCPTNSNTFGTDIGNNPLFRSYLPRTQTERHFPALGTQLEGRYDAAEVLPCHNRTLDFRVTARDNKSGQDAADMRVVVTNTGAAFEVLNLNAGDPVDSTVPLEVLWEVASTDLPPVNCSNVDIDLLTFTSDRSRHSVHHLATTTNSGNAFVSITPSNLSHPRARIRVKCSNGFDSYFYDISDADFVVNGTDLTPLWFDDTANKTYSYENIDRTSFNLPSCGKIAKCKKKSSSGGGSSIDYRWLLLMSGLMLIAARRQVRLARSFRAGSEP